MNLHIYHTYLMYVSKTYARRIQNKREHAT